MSAPEYTARAMSYLEVYRVSRNELVDLARAFPIAKKRLRWEALRLAFIRTVNQIGKKTLEARLKNDKLPPGGKRQSVSMGDMFNDASTKTDDQVKADTESSAALKLDQEEDSANLVYEVRESVKEIKDQMSERIDGLQADMAKVVAAVAEMHQAMNNSGKLVGGKRAPSVKRELSPLFSPSRREANGTGSTSPPPRNTQAASPADYQKEEQEDAEGK